MYKVLFRGRKAIWPLLRGQSLVLHAEGYPDGRSALLLVIGIDPVFYRKYHTRLYHFLTVPRNIRILRHCQSYRMTACMQNLASRFPQISLHGIADLPERHARPKRLKACMHTRFRLLRHLHILLRRFLSEVHGPGQVRGIAVHMAADIYQHNFPGTYNRSVA